MAEVFAQLNLLIFIMYMYVQYTYNTYSFSRLNTRIVFSPQMPKQTIVIKA